MRINGKQTDRRIIRTKKEILNALTLLLEQKTIDEITVKEMVAADVESFKKEKLLKESGYYVKNQYE